ncbi:MAG: hypothetical protein SVW57_01425 [Thermodesulfobacteriota bacterium]|nr:hypothetical protein [Thermodesulfobacteriota bacterium]
MNNDDTAYQLIPKEERKCVWMIGGLLSYKLCNRDYQCETCPLDKALRNEVGLEGNCQEHRTNLEEEESLAKDSSFQINGSVFYHPNHCWVKVDFPEKVIIGVDEFITQLIVNLKAVVLPQIGDFVNQGEYCLHIIQEDHILPIISPLSGSIQAVNFNLRKKPELITVDPLGEGWLIKVKPKNLEQELKHLLFGKAVHSWYKKEEKALMTMSDGMLKRNVENLGPTMQDGGTEISHLRNMLTHEQYAHILDSFFIQPKCLKDRY